MPSNPVPNLSNAELCKLAKLLAKYCKHIAQEQPLAAHIIHVVMTWVKDDLEP